MFHECFHVPGRVRAELRALIAVPVQASRIGAPDGGNSRAFAFPRSCAAQVLGFTKGTEQDDADEDEHWTKFGTNAEIDVDFFIVLSFATSHASRSRISHCKGFGRTLNNELQAVAHPYFSYRE
jgi:hypothetical protein